MSEQPESSVPHVVVRFMSCVYGRRGVRFDGGTCSPGGDLHVPGPEPQDRRHLTTEERERVLRAAWRETRATGRRRCVVFGPGDHVYVEQDGPQPAGAPPPSGGIRV